MPDPNAPVASPVATPGTELTVTQSTEPSGAPVAQPGRDAIIEKYEQMYGKPAEPVVATPAPVAQPVQPAPDLGGIVQALAAQVQELTGKLAAQSAPAPVVVTPAEEADWLKALAEGNKEAGEKLLAKKMAEQIGEQMQQGAVEKTMALIEAQNFANDVRRDNADLLPMEQFITAVSQQKIETAQRAGKIRTPADYVTVYKEAVTTTIADLRKHALTFRGEGRQEGQTRVAQVLASPNLQPSAVDTARGPSQANTDPAPQTTSDYLQERQAAKARSQGMLLGR